MIRQEYLLQQKQYYCNIFKDISGWDVVALQWKQHLYRQLGLYMPVDEHRKVTELNSRIHRIFGRRYSNREEWVVPKRVEKTIMVICPFRNAASYITDCIRSIAAQDYTNYEVHLIDDNSDDDSYTIANRAINELPVAIQMKFKITRNSTSHGALRNQVIQLSNRIGMDDAIVMLIDGDDRLGVDPRVAAQTSTSVVGRNCGVFRSGQRGDVVDGPPVLNSRYHVAESCAVCKHFDMAWTCLLACVRGDNFRSPRASAH